MVGNIGLRWVFGYSLVCSLMLLGAVAWAQPLPLVKLSDLSLSAGETLTVTASGLEPGATYTLTLTNENDGGALGAVQTEDVRADPQGDLSYRVQLGTPGRWRLNVQGGNLDARFEVEVMSRGPNAPAVAPPAVPGETVPGETVPGETVPGETVPDETPPTEPDPTETPPTETPPTETPPTETPPTETLPTETLPTEIPSTEGNPPQTDPPSLDAPGGGVVPGEQAEPPTTPSPTPSPTPGENAPQDDLPGDPQNGEPLERTPTLPDTSPPTEEPSPPALQAPGPNTQPLSLPDEVVLEDGAVVARSGDQVLWTLAFPPSSGETRGLRVDAEAVYVGHGNSLLTLDPATGVVQNRLALPSQVTDLVSDGLTVTTETETVALRGGEGQAPLPFAAEPALFGWLRAEAEVEDPAARLAQDPTNPWLYLRVGQALSTEPERARETFAAAVERAETFYDAAGLSRALLELGEPDLANEAFDKALQDFAARGYDPRLLRDLTLHEAYNFPLRPFQDALAAENLERADFWAPWLAYFATPDVPEVGRALRDYADLLRRNGQTAEVARWRDLSQGRLRTPGTLAAAARFLGRSGWYSALALLATVLALHLTLAAKYWRAQSVNFERRRLLNRSVSPVSRMFIMRFYSLTEKLVLFVLLVGVLLMAGLAAGYKGAGDVASLGSGTFRSAAAQSYLAAAPLGGPRGDFVQGYAAQVAGDTALARDRYGAAGDFAPALNNLGTLSGDETFYRRAAELARLPEARYNLGEQTDLFAFQRTYRPGDPLLAVPSVQDVQVALAGDWSRSVAEMFANPWSGLRAARPAGLDSALWTPLVVLFLISVAVTFVWLFIPRLRWVRNAPRTWVYHLLALLVPGSGLADEMWGLLLLVPWGLVGLDTLSHLYAWNIGIGWSLQTDLIVLAVIYLLNTVAVAVEFWSYRRRMAVLKRENSELALEFGLIRPARVRRLG